MKSVHELIVEFEAWVQAFFSHPDVVAAKAAAPVATPAAQPAAPATVTIPGTDRQIDAMTAAYLGVSAETSKILDDRVEAAKTLPAGDAQNSTGPLASFDKLWDQGRWTFKAGVAVDVPITAPAGSYRIQMSGSGGQAGEGGDSSAHVSVTVKDGGNVLGSGDANSYASFTKGDGPVVVTFLSDKDTLQAITLQTGAAVISR